MEYTIIITEKCNMMCSYCYQGVKKEQKYMQKDAVENVVKFILEKNTDDLKIKFLGGEPLLNFSVIEEFVNKFNNHNLTSIKYGITTNALLLDENIIEFLNKNNFLVRVSIDGDKETQGLNRKCSVKNSYEILIDNIKKLINSGANAIARMTATSNTIGLISKNVEFLYSIGFRNICVGIDYSAKFSKEYIEKFEREILKVEKFYFDKQKEKAPFSLDMIDGKIIKLVYESENGIRLCGAGRQHLVINSDGTIYPCTFVKNTQEFLIGNIHNSNKVESNKLNEKIIGNINNNNNNKCDKCEISYFCHGMKCGYVNYVNTGYFNSPTQIMCSIEHILLKLNIRVLEYLLKEESNVKKVLNYLEANNLKMSKLTKKILSTQDDIYEI